MTAGTPLAAGCRCCCGHRRGSSQRATSGGEGRVTLDAEEAMETLRGGLWHTTSQERFQGIRSRKAILSEPPLGEDERWGTLIGPEGWPYVRTLGGVSLFDFAGFDPEAYDEECPLSSWREFVPFRRYWGASVWIEIDRGKAAEALVGADELVTRWKRQKAYRHRIMPYIEACYLGDVPSRLFVRALVVGTGDTTFRSIDL